MNSYDYRINQLEQEVNRQLRSIRDQHKAINRLEAIVKGLNLGGCKYGKERDRRLERLSELRIPNDKLTKGDIACDDSCMGGSLGQCSIGCDGKKGLVEQWHALYDSIPPLCPVDNVPSCPIEDNTDSNVTTDPASDKSNKPRREPVELGDSKYGMDREDGLGGRTEGGDSEQKPNKDDSELARAVDRLVRLGERQSAWAEMATLGPVRVYCMGGACYE